MSKSDLQSLDFVVNRFLIKLFKTTNNNIIVFSFLLSFYDE